MPVRLIDPDKRYRILIPSPDEKHSPADSTVFEMRQLSKGQVVRLDHAMSQMFRLGSDDAAADIAKILKESAVSCDLPDHEVGYVIDNMCQEDFLDLAVAIKNRSCLNSYEEKN